MKLSQNTKHGGISLGVTAEPRLPLRKSGFFTECTKMPIIDSEYLNQNLSSESNKKSALRGGGDPFADAVCREEDFVIRGGVLEKYKGKDSRVAVPDGVVSVGPAFENHQTVKAVVLPEGVASIGGLAFKNCVSLNHLSLPQSLIKIGFSPLRTAGASERCVFPPGCAKSVSGRFPAVRSWGGSRYPRACPSSRWILFLPAGI